MGNNKPKYVPGVEVNASVNRATDFAQSEEVRNILTDEVKEKIASMILTKMGKIMDEVVKGVERQKPDVKSGILKGSHTVENIPGSDPAKLAQAAQSSLDSFLERKLAHLGKLTGMHPKVLAGAVVNNANNAFQPAATMHAYKKNVVDPATEDDIRGFLKAQGITNFSVSKQGILTGTFNKQQRKQISEIISKSETGWDTGYPVYSTSTGKYLPDKRRIAGALKTENNRLDLQTGQATEDMIENIRLRSTKSSLNKAIKGTFKEDEEEEESGGTTGKGGGGGTKGAISKKAAFAKGVLALYSVIVTLVTGIKNVVTGMYGILKTISATLGKVIKEAAITGIDSERLNEYRKVGLKYAQTTEQDEFIFSKAFQQMATKTANVTDLDSALGQLDTPAIRGRIGEVIRPVLKQALGRGDVEQSTNMMVGGFAAHYAGMNQKERSMQLRDDINTLTKAGFNDIAAALDAFIRIAEKEGKIGDKEFLSAGLASLINPKYNIANELEMGATQGTLWGTYSKGGFKARAQQAEKIQGDVNLLKDAFYMKMLSNIDLIKNILFSIARGVAKLTGNDMLYKQIAEREAEESSRAFELGETSRHQIDKDIDNVINRNIKEKDPTKKAAIAKEIRTELEYIAEKGDYSLDFKAGLGSEKSRAFLKNVDSEDFARAFTGVKGIKYYDEKVKPAMQEALDEGHYLAEPSVQKIFEYVRSSSNKDLYNIGAKKPVDNKLGFEDFNEISGIGLNPDLMAKIKKSSELPMYHWNSVFNPGVLSTAEWGAQDDFVRFNPLTNPTGIIGQFTSPITRVSAEEGMKLKEKYEEEKVKEDRIKLQKKEERDVILAATNMWRGDNRGMFYHSPGQAPPYYIKPTEKELEPYILEITLKGEVNGKPISTVRDKILFGDGTVMQRAYISMQNIPQK